jgi:hypothetical protein
MERSILSIAAKTINRIKLIISDLQFYNESKGAEIKCKTVIFSDERDIKGEGTRIRLKPSLPASILT